MYERYKDIDLYKSYSYEGIDKSNGNALTVDSL
jgi:hypothetical protein